MLLGFQDTAKAAKSRAKRSGKFFVAAAIAACWMTAATEPARGEVRTWSVGGESLSWESQQLASTALSFDTPGAIQLVEFNSQDNIIAQLNWLDEFPSSYVKERAEATVWDNVALEKSLLEIVDGIDTTSTETGFKRFGVSQAQTRFFFDLGTRFPGNRIAFFPRQEGVSSEGRPFKEDFIRGYVLKVNNGASFNEQDEPIYTPLKVVDFTRENVADFDFPLQFIRYIELEVISANPFELAEFQLFGTGFAPGASYRSKVIDLGESANFSRIEWTDEKLRQEGDSLGVEPAADAVATVLMRTGLDDNPRVYYEYTNLFTRERRVVTEDDYNSLDEGVRGPIEDDQTNWSLWSAPFTHSGQTINLPSPRRYFQFEVRLESRAILDGVQVTSLNVSYTIPPVAQTLIGEISQLDDPRPLGNVPVVAAGVFSTFAYDIIADVAETDTGFDGLRILTPSSRPLFREFLVGDPPASVIPDSTTEEQGNLTLFFPSRRAGTGTHRLRVVFDAEVFVQGTSIDAEMFDTQSGEAPQRLLPGDANPEVLTNALRVMTSAESTRDLLPFFQVIPRVFTPNGDGINDRAALSYTLVQLVRPVEVEVDILDLAGRRVRMLFSGEESSGAYTWMWDGRNDSGAMLPVGIYLVAVRVKAEQESFVQTGTVGLVY